MSASWLPQAEEESAGQVAAGRWKIALDGHIGRRRTAPINGVILGTSGLHGGLLAWPTVQ